MKIGLACSGLVDHKITEKPTRGRAREYNMPRPLVQKTCGFCAKTFLTKPGKKNCLCISCTEDVDILKYHVEHEQPFFVRIIGEENSMYRPLFWNALMKPKLPIQKGQLLGYVSPHTDMFFIGRVKKVMGSDKLLVKPTNRMCSTPIYGDHSVNLCDVRCLFVWHEHGQLT